jgi:hypothetical protein
MGSAVHGDQAEFIDFTSINFSGATVSYKSANTSNTSGTLIVSNGGKTTSVTLIGRRRTLTSPPAKIAQLRSTIRRRSREAVRYKAPISSVRQLYRRQLHHGSRRPGRHRGQQYSARRTTAADPPACVTTPVSGLQI